MSQVRFYPMKFMFNKLLELTTKYPSATEMAYIVFQLEMEDSNRNRDEYILTAYVVDSSWKVKEVLDSSFITPDNQADPYRHSGKLYFANYPLSRAKIDALKGLDPGGTQIEYLSFEPSAYPRQRKYVRYIITAVNKGTLLLMTTNGDSELNPSPPADPSV
jgi:hypothetical protein